MTVDDLIFVLSNRAYGDAVITMRNEECPDDRRELGEDDVDIYDDEVIIG